VAIAAIATLGWDGVSALTITQDAGVTIGAFYSRFTSKADLARVLWEAELGESLLGGLGQVVEAARDPEALSVAMRPFREGAPELVAAFELVLASQWEEPMRAPIFVPTSQALASWLDAERHGGVEAAVRVGALGLALGLLVRPSRPWAGLLDLDAEVRRHAEAFADPTAPAELDAALAAGAPLRVEQFSEVDPSTGRLLYAMVETVASMGYRRATVAQTAAFLGLTTGFLFARFATKLDLMVAAIEATWSASLLQSQQLALALTERFAPGEVEAALWREFLHPDLGDLRRFALEVERLARVEPSLMARVAHHEAAAARTLSGAPSLVEAPPAIESGMAMGIGLPALALLVPEIWTLPFSAVTVPLLASDPGAAEGLWASRSGGDPA